MSVPFKFCKSVSLSPRMNLFDDKIREKNIKIVKLSFEITIFYFKIFKNLIYSCDHYSSLQCHMILQKSV